MSDLQQKPRNITTLEKAIGDILLACKDATDNKDARRPFFFMVGSGISTPSIKMASEIQQDCMAAAASLGRKPDNLPQDGANAYSAWFETAYPHRVQRKRYLQSIIQGHPITYANFRFDYRTQFG